MARRAYEGTSVPIHRSQEKIRRMIFANRGTAIAFVTDPPREGVEWVQTLIEEGRERSVRVRVVARMVLDPDVSRRNPKRIDQELRRTWRVLYHHLKGIFEASASGVLDFREMILPYIVTKDNRTVADHLLEDLEKSLSAGPQRLLPSGREEVGT